MQNEWQTWLLTRGANLDAEGLLRFAPADEEIRRAASANVIADLSAWSLLLARGADAENFLQGQLSNDVRALADTTRLAAYCTAQGRMLALFRLFTHEGAFVLQTPSVVAETVVKRLRMYVLRAQVTLSLNDDVIPLGISGPDAATHVRALLGVVPDLDAAIHSERATVLRLPGPHPRFQIMTAQIAARALWEQAERLGLARVGAAAWRWLDIASGLPTVLPPTVEAFVPQMLNLDLVNGINFKKGCYPGQEIVARMHFLGRLKQRMYLGHLPPGLDAAPGDSVFAANFGDQAAGTVVDAQPSPMGGTDLLAAVQMSSVDAGAVRMRTPDGPALEFMPLPYPLATG